VLFDGFDVSGTGSFMQRTIYFRRPATPHQYHGCDCCE
jgi:hypothetical protein